MRLRHPCPLPLLAWQSEIVIGNRDGIGDSIGLLGTLPAAIALQTTTATPTFTATSLQLSRCRQPLYYRRTAGVSTAYRRGTAGAPQAHRRRRHPIPQYHKYHKYHNTTIPQYHNTTIPQYHITTIPQYHNTTIPQHHNTTIPIYCRRTAS